eukprot:4968014-Prymnesium_polylepis.1
MVRSDRLKITKSTLTTSQPSDVEKKRDVHTNLLQVLQFTHPNITCTPNLSKTSQNHHPIHRRGGRGRRLQRPQPVHELILDAGRRPAPRVQRLRAHIAVGDRGAPALSVRRLQRGGAAAH